MDERSSTPAGAAAAPASSSSPAVKDAFARAAAVASGTGATGAGAGAGPARPPAHRDESNIKETIESILVAFILAFIFRAFIVEAFVIPTGSMAPTLLGAHLRWECGDCGYGFKTNYSARDNDADGNPIIPARTGPVIERRRNGEVARRNVEHQIFCPNCGYEIPRSLASNVPVHYGDRILVLKYLYLFEDPRRWDVVVFKSPFDVPKYQQNYIKRLIGRPNESVVLLDGDVYVAPGPAKEIEQFRIQTKPKHVQDALWRVIYDNDHHPRGLARGGTGGASWRQPWTVRDGSGWELDQTDAGREPRAFHFENPTAGGTISFDRGANGGERPNYPFSDWLAYDVEERRWNPQVVGDLKLQFDYARTAGDGPLRLRLSKHGDTFTAELTPTTAKLFMRRAGEDVDAELASAAVSIGGRPVRIEFQNVDHCVTLRVDGGDVIQTTPQQYAPDARRLLEMFSNRQGPPLPGVEITAERQTSVVTHLSLWRDVHYLNRHDTPSPLWASPLDFPAHVIHLGPKEYFVLGDNSLMSLDARMWTDDIELADLKVESGRVPDRFMLGKAFFVYWPAGYKPANANAMPAITPNFGDMRFIR